MKPLFLLSLFLGVSLIAAETPPEAPAEVEAPEIPPVPYPDGPFYTVNAKTQEVLKDTSDYREGLADRVQRMLAEHAFPTKTVLLGLCAVVIVGLWRYGKRPRKKEGAPLRDPKTIALEKLQLLEKGDLLAKGSYLPFFVALSDVLRGYIEEAHGLRAPELSTEEFLAEIAHTHPFHEGEEAFLRQFLQLADLVKFAKKDATEPVCREALLHARAFVESSPSRQ